VILPRYFYQSTTGENMLSPKTKVAIYLIPFFILILSCDNIFAQNMSWHSNGPFLELNFAVITYFHSDPNIMLAGDNGVLYRSEDAGETWEYQCFYEGTISTIEIDPFLENVIYISTTSGLYKSEDYGKTWTKTELDVGTINTIAIDKNNISVIYAGAGNGGTTSGTTGIFKSSDGGGTWTKIYSEQIDGVYKIIIDHSNSSTIYASIGSYYY